MTTFAIIVSIALIIFIGLFALLLSQAHKREETLTADKAEAELKLQDKLIELTLSQAEVKRLKEKAESDRAELDKLQQSFRIEFKNLANDILEEKSRQFKQTNKESIDILLKPFQDNIKDFRERVERIYSFENEQRGALKSELKNLMELNQRITLETTNLTQALKGNSKVQGDFGEMILETILEQSSLQKGIHYYTQENFKDQEGHNLRPDVVLNLPEGKQIIIDSKVSLTAYVDYVSAEDESERGAALERHILSIRNHIKELTAKKYQDLIDGTPDFVIMFIPNEPAFMTALQNRQELWAEAYQKKIIISSPTNLFALLKIVDDLWKRDTQSRNAIAIAEAGGRLYDKFAGFVESLGNVDKYLKKASESCDTAFKQLSTGKGNLVSGAERLREMGAKASKQLPRNLTSTADDDSDEG